MHVLLEQLIRLANDTNVTCVVQLTVEGANQKRTKKKNEQSTRQETVPHSKRSRDLAILITLSLLLLTGCMLWINRPTTGSEPQPQQTQPRTGANSAIPNVPRAAILDGLYDTEPNPALIKSMTIDLSNAGYQVNLFNGTDVTIDLLRNVAGYKILILRLHSGVSPTDKFLYLFSGEQYTESKYVDEQLAGAVKKAYTFNLSEPPYFALNAVYLGNKNPNGLNGTTIILAGCNGTATPYDVQRFFQKGVKAYIAWNGYVDLTHSDQATQRLIEALCQENHDPKTAVAEVNEEIGPDPYFQSELVCSQP